MRWARPCQHAATPMPPCQKPGPLDVGARAADLARRVDVDVDARRARVAGPHADRAASRRRSAAPRRRRRTAAPRPSGSVAVIRARSMPAAPEHHGLRPWRRQPRASGGAQQLGGRAAHTPRSSSPAARAPSSSRIARASRWPSARRASAPSAAPSSASDRQRSPVRPCRGAAALQAPGGSATTPRACRVIVVEGDIGDQHGCSLPRRPAASRLSLARVTGRLEVGSLRRPPAETKGACRAPPPRSDRHGVGRRHRLRRAVGGRRGDRRRRSRSQRGRDHRLVHPLHRSSRRPVPGDPHVGRGRRRQLS